VKPVGITYDSLAQLHHTDEWKAKNGFCVCSQIIQEPQSVNKPQFGKCPSAGFWSKFMQLTNGENSHCNYVTTNLVNILSPSRAFLKRVDRAWSLALLVPVRSSACKIKCCLKMTGTSEAKDLILSTLFKKAHRLFVFEDFPG
jgi:hypothetical protein